MSWSATIPQTPARIAGLTVDKALTEMVKHYDYGRAELDQINATAAAWVGMAQLLFGDDELVAGSLSGYASDTTSQVSITLTKIQPVIDEPVPMAAVEDQLASDQSSASSVFPSRAGSSTPPQTT